MSHITLGILEDLVEQDRDSLLFQKLPIEMEGGLNGRPATLHAATGIQDKQLGWPRNLRHICDTYAGRTSVPPAKRSKPSR